MSARFPAIEPYETGMLDVGDGQRIYWEALDTSLETNTTEHLIGDIEKLRAHLGIERWLVWGGSWGVTLGLAYAQRYPERVTGTRAGTR